MLPFMLRIGMCPSADGARSPISEISTYLGLSIQQGSVELFRYRGFRFFRIKQAGIVEKKMKTAAGLSVKHDETAIRLCLGNNLCRSLNVSVRILTIHDIDGTEYELAPCLSIIESKKKVWVSSVVFSCAIAACLSYAEKKESGDFYF